MPSLCFVIVVAFTSLALEVLCETAIFPKSDDSDKMCGYNTEMNDELRRNFTDMHNYRRSQLALGKVSKRQGYLPAASNMIKLEWDCCLERNATEYVRTCPHEGSKEKQRDSRIGELYARVPVTVGDYKRGIREALTNWWKVVRQVAEDRCIGKDTTFFPQKHAEIKTFAQMAWAKTTKVGCAIGICPSTTAKDKEYVVVCRYFPKGNKENENVYSVGRACNACPNGYSCTAPFDCDQQNCQGLCI
ncbi:unnamed protein product [Cylicocyclus nassatus]|uniref:SCP domain-containing protein n=1 Tax=Cylicocyclus nassatus TaxID=53992 RepID=A0AA36H0B8_CYLNA|nr:unnamed protein product [Cylicocyclus nassatus]